MKSPIFILLAIVLGILSGIASNEILLTTANVLSTLFMNFLKFLAAPIVFLSIFSTLLNMSGLHEMKYLGKKVFTYTLLTTLLAASVALLLYLIIDPARAIPTEIALNSQTVVEGSYLTFFTNIIPSNLAQTFLENNVIGIAFLAFLFGFAAQSLPEEHRKPLTLLFSSLFKLTLKVTEYVIYLIPLGIWAFITLLVSEINAFPLNQLILYICVVLGANLVQGIVILPIFLKMKGLSPWTIFKGSSQALSLAFFSKSSNATLPVTLQCAEKKLGIQSKIANFSLPLCTVINMNGCAAFILITVLFVSQINGVVFSPWSLALWVVLASIAAIGNAGVPMGCFFLSSAFLVGNNVPVALMGVILPFYAVLDMVETALNVWSDLAVSAVIDKDVKEESLAQALPH